MSKPINVFTTTTKTAKTGNLKFLSQQVAYWQQLNQWVQPVLPQPEQWQVVCYQQGVLTVTGLNQAMISQLNYLQTQFVTQLKVLPAFKGLNKIRANLRYDTTPKPVLADRHLTLSPETQQMLRETARFIQDAKLSQALLALASDKK